MKNHRVNYTTTLMLFKLAKPQNLCHEVFIMSDKIKIAIIGVGNCCCTLVQGLNYYRDSKHKTGIFRKVVGGFNINSIEIVAAYDVDRRKVGKQLHEAVFAKPNCTKVFCDDIADSKCIVSMSPIMDGVAAHLASCSEDTAIRISDARQPERKEIIDHLIGSGAEILLNYLPVGSEQASRFYADCALEASLGFINCMPTMIANDPATVKKFEEKGLPIIGDDIKSQLGATIVHRTLVKLFRERGVTLDHTYQLNVGGNLDFLNMKDQSRLKSKKLSKTESVQSMTAQRLNDEDIHVGPSDYVPWLKDNKTAFIRLEGRLFGDIPMNLEIRLSVEDSPNSAGVAVDMIRMAKLARDKEIGGVLSGPSACYCKKPPVQMSDDNALRATDEFLEQIKEL